MPRQVSPPRRPLHEQSNSSTNVRAGIRLVPNTPPRPSGTSDDDIYSRTPLPTHPSHILSPGKVGQGSAMDISVSRVLRSPASTGSVESSVSTQSQTSSANNSATNSAVSTPRKTRPRSRSRKHIVAVHPDKTFSLIERDDSETQDKEQKSPTPSLSSQSSYGALPSDASNTPPQQRTSSLSCITDTTLTNSAAPTTPSLGSKKAISADPAANSPWNYRLVGGIRKVPTSVPTSPNEKQAGPSTEYNSESEIPEPTSPLGSVVQQPDQLGSSTDLAGNLSSKVSTDLSTKPSFQSSYTATTISENIKIYPIASRTESTISESPNYKVYPLLSRLDSNVSENPNYKVYPSRSRSDSDTSPVSPSSGNSNYEIHAQSSVAGSVAGTVIYRPRAETDSEVGSANFPDSPPSHSTYDSPSLQARPKYSQESLVVPPLNPKPVKYRRSNENLGYYKSRSRESLRTTGSLASISTVISQQEASRAISATPSVIEVPATKSIKPLNSLAEASSSTAAQRYRMEETPHQWSSQLSTVPSVSEETSERGSGYWSERRSSGFASNPSRHSTQILSISSSLALDDISSRLESASPDALTRPLAVFHRHGQQSISSAHLVADPDEHGDTITDMQDLRSYTSRNRLSALYNAPSPLNEGRGRSNSTRSTSSSRSTSATGYSLLPTWAKIYYGSGERRYLSTPGGSSTSGDESRPSTAFQSRSPSIELPTNLYNPRRRPREVEQQQRERQSTVSSLDITPAPPSANPSIPPSEQRERQARTFPGRRYPGFRTWSMSSVWSPHLRLDKRTARQNVWERPPSMTWSSEGGWFGRRNVQILMFVFGFLFPVAWIAASFLPLPRNPLLKLESQAPSEADISNDYNAVFGPMDEARYESARWWRTINRWMSVIGVLVIITIIVLAVLGTTQGL